MLIMSNVQEFEFGAIIKRERKNKEMSLSKLSEESTIEASYINRLEKGNRDNPGFKTVVSIVNALNLDQEEVLNSFGFDRLGNVPNIEKSDLKKLIEKYISTTGDVNGYIPQIITSLENMRNEYQENKQRNL